MRILLYAYHEVLVVHQLRPVNNGLMCVCNSVAGIDGTLTSLVSIGQQSGVVTAAALLRYDVTPRLVLLVTATDGGEAPLSATATLTVRLYDSRPVFRLLHVLRPIRVTVHPSTLLL